MSDGQRTTSIVKWEPTPGQRSAKARFHDRVKDGFRAPESYSLAEIAQIAQTPSVKDWMANPSFAAWFFNKDVVRQKLLATQELAVDRLVAILQETDMGPKGTVTAPAVVRAAELLMNFSGMAPPKKTEVAVKTDAINNMNREQLRVFLMEQFKRLAADMSPEEIRNVVGTDKIDAILIEESTDE